MLKKIFIFSDGSNLTGTGHLRRAQTLIQKLNSSYEIICIATNNFQKKFFLQMLVLL